jgi:cell division protein FtsI (penicillin-binding protein 3)
MKYKSLFFLIFFSLLSCKKSELSIAPANEKKLCQTAYKSNSEAIDGYNVKTFLDSNIQKTAEEALKNGLISSNADYGCVVIMETNSGKVKAMVNLSKELDGSFKYKTTTAVSEVNEPGGLMRTFDLLALLEDKKADTTTVFDTHGGEFTFSGKKIRDSNVINGKISLAKAFLVSSNTVFAQAINNSYSTNPSLFCNRFNNLGFNKTLGLPFENEGLFNFPEPNKDQWSAISLPWLSMGYGLSLTPVQLLTYYNAIANNGVMVKPLFLSEIKDKSGNIKTYSTEVVNPKIASEKTVSALQYLLTKKAEIEAGAFLFSNNVKIAGNAAAVRLGYVNPTSKENKYLASYVGYFPANKPKYSLVCFIYNPKKNQPVYGSVECGGVIKEIVEKVK